jgi:hypothetical protein
MFVDTRFGGKPRFLSHRPKDWNMRIPEEIRKCVVFLCSRLPSGAIVMRGTGFLVGVHLGGTGQMIGYIVTAKHVADLIEGTECGVRINLPSGAAETFWIGADMQWCRHPSEPDSVDAAVMPFPFRTDADFRALDYDMFLTDDIIAKADIGPGDQVVTTGLFLPLQISRNEPIVRTGNVAVMPRDRVPRIKIGANVVEAEVYLVEVRSVGGLSGSPVFVTPTIRLAHPFVTADASGKEDARCFILGGTRLYLMGLMHGHWTIEPAEHDRYDFATSTDPIKSIAVGIAVVVPAKKIAEIIDRPDLVEHRKRMEQQIYAGQATTPTA